METDKTVLLVEDELLIAMAETLVLERNGYRVVSARTGEAAVELAAASPEIDLILMDIDLGDGINGTEAAEIILSKRELPLVFLSSHVEPEVVQQTEGITSYGYIVKNSGETVLLASMRMAFRLFEEKLAVKKQEELLNGVFNSIQDGMSVLDSNLVIQHVNHAMERWYPEPHGLVGRTCHSVYHHSEEVCAFCPSIRALRSGNVEHAVVPGRADSPVEWLELYAYPMKDTSSGETVGIVEFVRNISEKRRLEEELSAGELRFQTIMDSMQDVVFTLDAEGRHTGIYGTWAQSYGLTPEHFLGKTFSEILGADAAQVHEQAAAAALTGTFTVYDWSVSTEEGASYFQTSLSPMHTADGSVSGLVGVARDLSTHKQNEKQLKIKTSRLQLLLRVGESLSNRLQVSEILPILAETATELAEMDTAAIYLLSGSEVYLAATTPPLPPDFPEELRRANPEEHPHIRTTLMERRTLVVPDFTAAELSPEEQKAAQMRSLRSVVFVPLVGHGGVLGVLIVATTEQLRQVSEDQLSYCRTVATQASLAIENARLHESLHRQLLEHMKAE